MKEFDLEKAKAGAKVCTRDGREARIVCFDMDNEFPIVALVRNKSGEEIVRVYGLDGRYLSIEMNHADLMLAGEKKEGWINVHECGCCGKIYATKEEAIEARNNINTCVDTIHIEWEE